MLLVDPEFAPTVGRARGGNGRDGRPLGRRGRESGGQRGGERRGQTRAPLRLESADDAGGDTVELEGADDLDAGQQEPSA